MLLKKKTTTMIRHKFYPTQPTYPYYTFSWSIYLWNLIIVKASIWWAQHFTYGIYGKVKHAWLSTMVSLKLREPLTDLDCIEYFFDL